MKNVQVKCKKYLSITNAQGANIHFDEDNVYNIEILNLDSGNFCAFFYDRVFDNRYRIIESVFKKHFYTINELRKLKLNKIKKKNEMSI